MGLKMGDIITHINNIPATTTDKRYEIYKTVTSLSFGDTITIQLTRKTIPFTVTYSLKDSEENGKKQDTKGIEEKTPYDIDEEKRKVLERKYRFAPSAQELRRQDKQAMIHASPTRQGKHNRNILIQSIIPEIHVGT